MEKRYTLPVAIALVVGTVIGSGVFFKAEAVLTKTGGNLSVGILAFIIMGVVMIISACTFGVVAQSHEGVEGLVGYASASCGKGYGYYVVRDTMNYRFNHCIDILQHPSKKNFKKEKIKVKLVKKPTKKKPTKKTKKKPTKKPAKKTKKKPAKA